MGSTSHASATNANSAPRALSVVGLGKLGSPLLACFAEKGFHVIGYDLNPALVQAIAEKRAPFVEPGLQDMLTRNAERITASSDPAILLAKTDATFVIVPTPSVSSGGFTTEYLQSAFTTLGEALRAKSGWHLFVVTSTVLPGAMDTELVPILERASGKKAGVDFGVCYSPLFIALGCVIRNILNPDFTLVGELDERSGETLTSIYRQLVDNGATPRRMNFVNAELAKISVNSYVTMKISFANQLAELCEKLPGANVDVVTSAVGSDTRVGGKYLKGALGYGGPCFPRDNKALSFVARTLGAKANLAEATDLINDRQVSRVVDLIGHRLPSGSEVAVVGLAYKPDTPVVEESQGVMICQQLQRRGFRVRVYDPLAMDGARAVLAQTASYAENLALCVREADAVIIALPGPIYAPDPLSLRSHPRPLVVDCWGSLNFQQFAEVSTYVKLGMHGIART